MRGETWKLSATLDDSAQRPDSGNVYEAVWRDGIVEHSADQTALPRQAAREDRTARFPST
jgi:hypothetical protein